MYRLVYISKAAPEISDEVIMEITDISVERNRSLEVTGFLTFRHGTFVQFLEGPRNSVEEIWASIREDERHKIGHSWTYSSDGPRYFPDWHMRYLRAENMENRLYDMLGRTFDLMQPPFAEDASDMLDKLIGEVAQQVSHMDS